MEEIVFIKFDWQSGNGKPPSYDQFVIFSKCINELLKEQSDVIDGTEVAVLKSILKFHSKTEQKHLDT